MINLLPVKKREEVIAEYKSRRVLAYASVLSFVLFLSIIILLLFFTIFFIQRSGLEKLVLEEDSENKAKEFDELNALVKDLNSQIGIIVETDKFIKPSSLLEGLDSQTPSGVQILFLSFDLEGNKLLVNGSADTRQRFLLFLDNLKNSELYESVDSPASNLVSEQNVLFKIELKPKQNNEN